jgi:hypothetical protein
MPSRQMRKVRRAQSLYCAKVPQWSYGHWATSGAIKRLRPARWPKSSRHEVFACQRRQMSAALTA